MCEVLLRVREPESKRIDQRLLQNKAGDAVFIAPDGHQWSKAELSSPDWRVLRLPGLPVAALQDLMAVRVNSLNKTMTAKKAHYIEIDDWLRPLLAAGNVIEFTDSDAARLLALKRIRNDDFPIMVG
jgi:hypothetical protein